MFDYQEELESAVTYYRESMPERIRRLIGLASYDLWHGPIFYDQDTLEEESEDATPFPFESACAEIREWLDSNVSPISVESSYDDESGESEHESVNGSERDIIRKLCGKALSDYI